jgi:hypothetical protein
MKGWAAWSAYWATTPALPRAFGIVDGFALWASLPLTEWLIRLKPHSQVVNGHRLFPGGGIKFPKQLSIGFKQAFSPVLGLGFCAKKAALRR